MKKELDLKNKEISELKSELKEKNSKIEILERNIAKLKSIENNNNNSTTKISNDELEMLYAQLQEKKKKIEKLNDQLIGSIKYDDLKLEDKLIAINFTSSDSKINFPIICKTNSLFSEIESILYKKYPDFAENDGEDNLFLANGVKMKRFKSLEENGFPGYAIMVMKRDLNN